MVEARPQEAGMSRPTRLWIAVVSVALLAGWGLSLATRDATQSVLRSSDAAVPIGTPESRQAVTAHPPETAKGSSSMAAAQALLDESRKLQACERLLSMSESELETEERRIGAGFEEVARARGVAYDSASAAQEIEERIAARLARRRECQALPPATVAGWWNRLERAALAGNLAAMEDYGHLVVQASADAGGVFANIDEMARRKRLAFGFMRKVAAAGNCNVSGDLERLSPDATSRYAFALVSVEVTRRFNDRLNPEASADNVRFMQSQADRTGAGLGALQAAESRRLATQVISACRDP